MWAAYMACNGWDHRLQESRHPASWLGYYLGQVEARAVRELEQTAEATPPDEPIFSCAEAAAAARALVRAARGAAPVDA